MKNTKHIITILAILFFISCEKNEDDNKELIKYKIYDIADTPINSGGTDIIESISIDEENNIWMGCRPLIKFNGNFWETYGQDIFGERNCCGNDIDFDSKGNLWFGTNNGLFKYNGVIWESFFYIEEHPYHTSISCVHCDNEDNVWFSEGSDLCKYDGAEWITYEYNKDFFGRQIQKITSDSNGNIFIGCYDALYKFDGNEFIKIYYSKNGGDMNVRDLDFDKNGKLWISCRSDLLVLNENEITAIDTVYIENPHYNDYNWNVSSIALNNQNNDVVIGTWNTGIGFYNNQDFVFFRGGEFGIDSAQFQINELEFDNNNNLWIVTRFGKIIVYNEKGIEF